MTKKLQYIILGLIGLSILVVAGFYGLQDNKAGTVAKIDYLAFIENYEIKKEEVRNSEDLQKKYAERFEAAKKKILEDANVMQYWLEAASVKMAVGDYEGAEKIYLYVNELRPNNSTSFANLGSLYTHQLINYPKAEEMYLKNLENDPADIHTWRNLYELYKYHYTEKSTQAAVALEQAVKAMPTEASLWAMLAAEYEDTGNIQAAILAWEEYLKLEPNNQQAREAIYRLSN